MKLERILIDYIKQPGLIKKYFIEQIQIFSIRVSFKLNHFLGKKNLVFHIASPGEFWYVEPIWNQLKWRKDFVLFFSVLNDGLTELSWPQYIEYLVKNGVPREKIIDSKKILSISSMDLYLSSTAWISGIPKVDIPKIQIFHTLGSKSMKDLDNLLNFNILFLTGQEMKDQIFSNFFKLYPHAKDIKIFEIGYPKSDALINKSYNKEEIMKYLGLDPSKPTVIYAPNWELEASLYKMGYEIIRTLAKMNINVLIKLHHGSYRNPKQVSKTGGIDWKKEIEKYRQEYPNIINIFDFNSNPYLYVSDIMITDAGGVGFEYILLDKPVIFFDVPEYFERYGSSGIDYWGRKAGKMIKKPEDLQEAIKSALNNPIERSDMRKELKNRLIYNPGNSARKASEIIIQLLDRHNSKKYSKSLKNVIDPVV